MADAKGTQAVFTAMRESRRVSASKKPMVESKPARRKVEGEEVMDDVIDNITVVTDPSKDADELEARADKIQDAIEDAPEGEEAFSDEYVGDTVYACPVCGESFFADSTYHEGDACPICQAEPSDGFLNQGVVVADEPADDFEDEFEDEDLAPVGEEPEDEPEEEEEPGTFEAIRNARRAAAKRRRKTEGAEFSDVTVEDGGAVNVTVNVDAPADTPCEGAAAEPEYLDYELDDESFNGALTDFVTENYGSSVRSMKMVRASYNPKADTIKIECRLLTKKGQKVPAIFVMKEAKNYGNRSLMTMSEATNTFKMESAKTPALKANVIRVGKTLACESIAYGYTTSHPTAGKVRVEGIARGFQSARAKMESKAPRRTPRTPSPARNKARANRKFNG